MTVTPVSDPCVGNLATPVNSGYFIKGLINNLPLYRPGVSPNFRGLETGAAFGYLLFGPFTICGPFGTPNTSKQLVCWLRSVPFISSACSSCFTTSLGSSRTFPVGCDRCESSG